MTATLPSWLTHDVAASRCRLALHIQPGAKHARVIGEHGQALKIALQAPAIDGKANAALIQFLADRIKCPRTQITLISGEHARQKVINMMNVTPAQIVQQLTPNEPRG